MASIEHRGESCSLCAEPETLLKKSARVAKYKNRRELCSLCAEPKTLKKNPREWPLRGPTPMASIKTTENCVRCVQSQKHCKKKIRESGPCGAGAYPNGKYRTPQRIVFVVCRAKNTKKKSARVAPAGAYPNGKYRTPRRIVFVVCRDKNTVKKKNRESGPCGGLPQWQV